MTITSWLPSIGSVILPNLGGIAGAFFTPRPNKDTWYKNLNKPPFNPPNWVFAPAWTTLYSMMGYASYVVWRDGGGFHGDAKIALTWYGAQLLLNWIWTPLFFGARRVDLALLENFAYWGAAATTLYHFNKISRVAFYFFAPHLAWISFAIVLNFEVWRLNRNSKNRSSADRGKNQ